MMPGNPVVGGTVLRRAAIQSPNFVQSPLAGWAVNADGSAFFANVTISGGVTATEFDGTNFVINPAGAFFYSGTPAAGNLLISIANAAGTDGFGNAYPEGVSVGLTSDSAQVQLIPSTVHHAAEVVFPVPSPALGNTPNIAGGKATSTVANLLQSGPGLAAAGFTDWVQTVMYSNDGTGTEARMEFRYVDTSGGAHVIASYDGNGWVMDADLSVSTINGSPNTGTAGLPDGTIAGSSSSAGLPDGTINGTSGTHSAQTSNQIPPGATANHQHDYSHSHDAGGYAVTNGVHSHAAGSYAVTNGVHDHAI